MCRKKHAGSPMLSGRSPYHDPAEVRCSALRDHRRTGYGSHPYAITSGGTEADRVQRRIYCGTQCQYFRETESYRGQICRGRYDGRIDAIIDGGEVGIGLESTIIDLTVSPPQILRPGYITREKLSAVLGTVDTDATILRAVSGQAPRHLG